MKNIIVTVLLGLLILCSTSVTVWALDGNRILLEVDHNMQPESYEMYRKLINIEPDGVKKEYVLYTVKKGQDKMVALFLSPASEKGRSTLRLGENMWLYIPNVGKPIRITSLQSIIGGVFNNSDILRLDFSAEYDVSEIDQGADQYLLNLTAKSGSVAYHSLKMRVDRETLLPTVIECFAASGMLIKTLHYSKNKDFGEGVVRPSVLETDSPLYKGYRSVMLFGKVKKRELADEVFSLNYLSMVDDLR